MTETQPTRILQVFSRMDRGGAETMIMTYYRNIDRTKVQFDFVVHTDEVCEFDNEIEELGGKIYRFPRYSISSHFSYQKKWKLFLKSHPEYKIIHAHFFTISAVYFQVARKLNRVCIAHSHTSNALNSSILDKIKYFFYIFPNRFLANYFLSCSKDAALWMFGKKTSRHAHILKNSIDITIFDYNAEIRTNIRERLNLSNSFVVGHIGRFDKSKNQSFLIDIFNSILTKKNNSKLLLIGDGEFKKDIEEKVKKLGLTNSVIFAGVRSDVPELLQAMDVFVFPSLFEGLGIVLIEAQATGLKAFTSKDVVPTEAKITELLKYIPLNESIDTWADTVLSVSEGYNRTTMKQEIVRNGYDIKMNADWLQKFYLNL